jgi:hypothetical protein
MGRNCESGDPCARYRLASFVYVIPSIFMLIGYWRDLEADRQSPEQGEGEALIDQGNLTLESTDASH